MPTASANQMLFHWLSVPDPSGATLFWLSALAQWPLYSVPVILLNLWLFGERVDREAAIVAGTTGVLALFMAHLASVLIDHPRPFMVGLAANVLDHPADSSFPSDHATLLFALAAGFAFRPVPRLRWLGAALLLTGLAVGWARVALGVHFPFDILGAGTIAGLSEVFVSARGMRRPLEVLTRIAEVIRDRFPLLPDRCNADHSTSASGDARPAR
ncbi:undecaprenyl-diphosphatase [Lichenifustis flavocetrariae]|uniref:Undecaprenyl-diphosphatase n=1 Tax=Lichenifustis flavocetrariae TaxID=2949735 RepID=A0AA42CMW1_9HYPH|nr:undecaprenyl-diphosphatase [Lichenifustis flavocetrariae]MCW6513114.1 undecaprenyl-diphosphatase [Lichenifustis flavocetrariae]